MKNTIICLAILWLFTNCEKVIDLDLGTTNSKIVIEGNITNQAGPYVVKITQTVSFSEASQYPAVTNATVTISDNTGQSETLTHTGNGVYKTNNLKGISGRTYTLKVVAAGTTYTAQSTLPEAVNLDSLLYRSISFGGTTNNTVTPVYTDAPAIGNNYRFVLKVNNVLDKTYLIDNDNTNNGKTNDRPLRSNDITIKSGNTVTVEMQCVDSQAYLYYFTLAQMAGNGPGGGTTPSNPPNGFTNGALGLFSAHTSQVKSIVIP